MFSAVPVPQFEWNEKNMRYAMCAFPLIGLVIGGLWSLCGALPLPALVKAGGFCLLPVWVTGGIHLDGYADTCDALSSYGDREKKLEILKDPHCGAFAVIRLCSYFLAYFCAVHRRAVYPAHRVPLDAGSGAGAGTFRPCRGRFPPWRRTPASPTPLLQRRTERRSAAFCSGWPSPLCAALTVLGGWGLALAALLVFVRYYVVSKKQFGGITGDLAGWFFAESRAVDAGGAVCVPMGRAVMIFITGPLYSGKRTFANALPGTRIAEVQNLAKDADDLEKTRGQTRRL